MQLLDFFYFLILGEPVGTISKFGYIHKYIGTIS